MIELVPFSILTMWNIIGNINIIRSQSWCLWEATDHVDVVDGVQPDELVLLDEVVEDGEDVVEKVDQLLRIRASRDDDVEAVDLGHRQGGALLYLGPISRVIDTRSVAPSNFFAIFSEQN